MATLASNFGAQLLEMDAVDIHRELQRRLEHTVFGSSAVLSTCMPSSTVAESAPE